ncbi:MAG: hypothetical protein R3F59_13680 [Myxococcota bacterium]
MIAAVRGDADALERLQEVVVLHREVDAVQDLLLARANLAGAVPAHPDDREEAVAALEAVAAEALAEQLPQLAALAWLYAARQLAPDDPAARSAADRAVAHGVGTVQIEALLTRGWLVAATDPARAADDLRAAEQLDDEGQPGLIRAALLLGQAELAHALGRDDAPARREAAAAAVGALGLGPRAPFVQRLAALR